MNVADICIAFTVSILAVAYPLLLTVIARLDDKYSSILILELFRREREWIISKIALVSTLALIFAYILLNFSFAQYLQPSIRYIHIAFLLGSLITLILFLFLFIGKVLTYFTPTRVLQYFINKEDDEEHLYFRAIADLLYFSIRQQDEVISKTISDYMYRSFLAIREKTTDEPVLYPAAFYEVVNKVTIQLASLDNKKFAFLDFRVPGGVWLLGELQDVQIHETTYFNLWRNLITAVEYERDDMIMHYWGHAHQHFIYQLSTIYEEYAGLEDDFKILNQEAVDSRNLERKRFLQFNYALGGLLIYTNRYKVIGRIFKYTTSQPPSYDLLPLSMWQIFVAYFSFRDPYHENFSESLQRYYYPDSEGIGAEGLVTAMTSRYFALLFLRQWSIIPYLVTIRPFDFPQAPQKQSEKKIWIEQLPYFKHHVEQVLKDPKLLSDTNLDMINEEWCKENNKPNPLQFIDDFLDSLKQSFNETEENQPVSEGKAEQFYQSSTRIIKGAIKPYYDKFNRTINKNYDNWFVNGIRTPMEKSPFAEDQGVSHLNFDSFIAGLQAKKIQYAISETFFYKTKHQYLLKGSEIFSGIDRTKIGVNTHVIINFGLNLESYTKFEKIDGLTDSSYKNIEIITFEVFNRQLLNNTLFLIRKQDLPCLLFKNIDAVEIAKYDLRQLDADFRLYGAVIDLNLSHDIASEIASEVPDVDIQKSVLLYLAMQMEIRWKKRVKLVALIQYSEYKNSGAPNSLRDVRKF
ncbi:MAG: hypothetical protein JSU01_14190 [Bacteroidetes bacterium]|nr:hypothetical protein [Bacteroidota bacterium]